jgi:hypothetical protein
MNETLDEKQEDEHVHIVESMEMCIYCVLVYILCTLHLYIRIRVCVYKCVY